MDQQLADDSAEGFVERGRKHALQDDAGLKSARNHSESHFAIPLLSTRIDYLSRRQNQVFLEYPIKRLNLS